MSPRPKELWLGEVEVEAGERELILEKALPTEAELRHELETEWHYGAQDLHATFHCYVERRRCADCRFLKDGPIIGHFRKAPGALPSWCDYWACYGASPEGYCFRYEEK